MATHLPFNYFSGNSKTIESTEFVHGSGSYRETGNDNPVTTADGRIRMHRRTIEPSAEFEVYGDRSDLASATGLGTAIALKIGDSSGTLVSHASFVGVVSAEYSNDTNTTRVSVEGDPIED